MRKRYFAFLVALLFIFIFTSWVSATEKVEKYNYPSKPISVVVPYAAGGGTDLFARALVGVASQYFDVPVRVVVMPGEGAARGTRYVVDSEPDGYTLCFNSGGAFIATPHVVDAGYMPRDLVGIARATIAPYVLIVNPGLGVKTFDEFIEWGKANPGFPVGTSGVGSLSHIGCALFFEKVGLEPNIIVHEGAAESVLAVAGGHVKADVTTIGSGLSAINSGSVIPLVLLDDEPSPSLKDVPISKDVGLDFTWATPRGLLAPKGVPEEILDYLDGIFAQVIADTSFVNLAKKLGEPPRYLNRHEFTEYFYNMSDEVEKIVDRLLKK
ncbi:MAG: tripartite tricarboxylate transporter substrate binding protein [Candidatus Caldatribacteriota bacterium]